MPVSVPDLWCNDEVMPPIKDCRIRPESDHRITCHIRIRFDMLSHILFYESFCLIFCLPQSIFPVRIIACSVLVERGLLLLQTYYYGLFWTFRLSVSQYTNHLLEIIRNIYVSTLVTSSSKVTKNQKWDEQNINGRSDSTHRILTLPEMLFF